MIDVVCEWPDGAWALIFGLVEDDLNGIIEGAHLIYPVRTHPTRKIVPLAFVLCTPEIFGGMDMMELHLAAEEQFPDCETLCPVMLDEEVIRRIQIGDNPRLDPDRVFGHVHVTGWSELKFVEIRYGKDEAELIAGLEGSKVDQRP